MSTIEKESVRIEHGDRWNITAYKEISISCLHVGCHRIASGPYPFEERVKLLQCEENSDFYHKKELLSYLHVRISKKQNMQELSRKGCNLQGYY